MNLEQFIFRMKWRPAFDLPETEYYTVYVLYVTKPKYSFTGFWQNVCVGRDTPDEVKTQKALDTDENVVKWLRDMIETRTVPTPKKAEFRDLSVREDVDYFYLPVAEIAIRKNNWEWVNI